MACGDKTGECGVSAQPTGDGKCVDGVERQAENEVRRRRGVHRVRECYLQNLLVVGIVFLCHPLASWVSVVVVSYKHAMCCL